jgi:hypothetical protein
VIYTFLNLIECAKISASRINGVKFLGKKLIMEKEYNIEWKEKLYSRGPFLE